jgi:hypothetical protein
MASHGDFGAVATVSKQILEDVLWAYTQVGPIYFPAPDSVRVGNVTVAFGGIFEMLRPTIDLQPFPANLITFHFAFHSILQAGVSPGIFPNFPFRTYDVEIRGSVTLAPFVTVQNNQILLGINTKSFVFAPLTAITRTGPALPPSVLQALQSQTLADIVTSFVQNRPNIILTPPTLHATFEKTVPANFKDVGTSIFNWFTIRLIATNILFKMSSSDVTVAVDFLGYTNGDINQPISGMGLDNVWIETRTPKDVEEDTPPYIWKGRLVRGGNFGVLFNMSVLSRVVDSISSQTAHTFISQNAELRSISLGYATFTKPLYPGIRDGIKVSFQVTLHPLDFNAYGAVYIQPVIEVYDGPTAFLRKDAWSLRIVHNELDVSWLVDLVVFALSAVIGVICPFLIPILAIAAIAITDGIIPGVLDNIRNYALGGVERGLLALDSPSDPQPLPGLPNGMWSGEIRDIAILPEGLHTVLDMSAGVPDAFIAIYQESGIRAPEDWRAEIRRPMPFLVKVSGPLEKLAPNLSVLWEVFRVDNNALLRAQRRAYVGKDILVLNPSATIRGVQPDPGTNGILIGLRDPDYYFLDRIKVRCTLTAKLGTQEGFIWSDEVIVDIPDDLDRTRNFVEWGPHLVFFANAGTNNETWSHNRTSKIHRTATGARCMMLRQRAEDTPRKRPKFRYFDTLPAEWTPLANHRHFLCDFCFFGGPDKTTPFPLDKWF